MNETDEPIQPPATRLVHVYRRRGCDRAMALNWTVALVAALEAPGRFARVAAVIVVEAGETPLLLAHAIRPRPRGRPGDPLQTWVVYDHRSAVPWLVSPWLWLRDPTDAIRALRAPTWPDWRAVRTRCERLGPLRPGRPSAQNLVGGYADRAHAAVAARIRWTGGLAPDGAPIVYRWQYRSPVNFGWLADVAAKAAPKP